MSAIYLSRLHNSAACLALLASGALLAFPASAQQLPASSTEAIKSSAYAGGLETIVVSGTAFNPETAPAKASLDAMQPQTVISKSYIADSVSATADYTTILAIAPGLTGFDKNGPGFSDGGVKNTMRGLPDGSYGMSYDGIPFGDTNGPTHHSQSYFPGSTIGSIEVERGPGNAGNLGASTYGGSINMFSEVLTPNALGKVSATAGNWGTAQTVVNYQTGDFAIGGINNRAMINIQYSKSDGYLTLQSSAAKNITIKTQTELTPGWNLTLFSSFNGLFQNVNDKDGITAAQVIAFDKAYALQNTNPNAGNYAAYNHVHKKSDMEYARLQGELGNGFSIDNTLYTYDYRNKTLSTTSVQQTTADIAKGVTQANGSIVKGIYFPDDVPGYTKQNAFRVYGNIFRAAKNFDFGWLTGQLRAGVWSESQSTQRTRSDYDATKCFSSANCNPWHDQSFADSRLYNSTSKPTTVVASPTSMPYGGGFFEYVEHSNWSQYQPFVELELHPLEDLTVTPGFKYVEWSRSVAAPLEQKTKPVVPVYAHYTTYRDLPFVMANYKIQPSWSVYAQYAEGIYVPDITSFEQAKPTTTYPKAQTTTNYQVGTVFYADHFTFDADFYYIGVANNITYQACNIAPFTGTASETCALNTGKATYRGIEGEGTYAFDGDLEGFSVFLNGSLGSGKTNGKWIKEVPMWTSAQGIFYKRGAWKVSLIDKIVGQQYSDASNSNFYKLGAYSNMDFTGSYSWDALEFSLGVSNVLNSRSIGAVSPVDKTPIGGSRVDDIFNRGGSLDTYSFQPSRGYQFTIKTRF